MASYAPPSNNLTLFNPDQFFVDSSLLEFPVAQGQETFPNGLTTSTATVVGALTAGSAYNRHFDCWNLCSGDD